MVIHSMAMNRVKISMAKPMSSSTPMITMAAPQATRIGKSGRGSRTSRSPTLAVGIDRSSFFSAK